MKTGRLDMKKIILFLCFGIFLPVSVFCQTSPFYPNDPYFFYNAAQLPYFPGQWHLENNAPSEITWTFPIQPDGPDWYKNEYHGKSIVMKNSGVDTNVVDAWKKGFTGKGVVIGIADNGTDGTNEDIAPNYSAALSRNFLGGNIYENQGPVKQSDNHGTAVAGVAAARGGNGIGGTGAAPYATIAGLRVLDSASVIEDAFNAYMWKSGVDFKVEGGSIVYTPRNQPEIHIKNHSYGFDQPFKDNVDIILRSLHETAANGVIHVFAAGNYRGTDCEDANKLMRNSYRDVIDVAALGSDGKYSNYSSYGASIFVTAPSNRTEFYKISQAVSTGFGILTTDRTGKNLGYNAYSANNRCGDEWADCGDLYESFPDYSYTSTFGGTSSAAPLVSGILALGKEANPDMDVRMAKHVLVKTSDRVDPDDASTTGKWLKNGAGNWFNPNYGFGNINAGKFVDMVQKVAYVTQQTSYSTGTQNVNAGIRSVDNGGTTRTFTLTKSELTDSIRQPLEGVEVLLNFTHPKRGDLAASMTSPSGMQSLFLNSTSHLPAEKQDTASVTNFEWTFLTNAFWGESGLGTWSITMVDEITDNKGTWNSYNVTFLMGDIVLVSDLPDTQQTDIKARSLTLANANKTYSIPSGLKFQARDNVKVEAGSLVVNGDITEDASGFGVEVNIEGGTVSGVGSITAKRGISHSGGIISPGNSIGTLNIKGNYAQGANASLLIEVASPISNDLLAITGAADIAGILQTSWTGGATPKPGTRLGTILTATSGVTGRFSRLLTNITPTVMFKPKYDIANQIYLMVERDYINENIMPYLTANQQAIGSMLNSVGNTATGDLNTVLGAIDSLTSYSQTASALEQLLPISSNVSTNVAINSANFQSGNISSRLGELRSGFSGFSVNGYSFAPFMVASSGRELTGIIPQKYDGKWGFFVRGSTVLGDKGTSPDEVGYKFTTTGITIGSDYRFSNNFIAGVMAGFYNSKTDISDAGSKVKLDGYTLGLYKSYYTGGFYSDAFINYSYNRYDNTRRIVFPGIDRTATSKPSGHQFAAYGGAGYDFKKGNLSFGPTLSLQYVYLNLDSYTESGAGALNLDVERQTGNSFQSNIGGRMTYKWQTKNAEYLPSIWASYGHEFLNNSKTIDVSLSQGSSVVGIETASPDRNFVSLGAGITAVLKNNAQIFCNYNFQAGNSRYIAQTINAGLRLQF
ncbi:MAG TPA: autotransporter domain-containing protein [Syntrophorhabdaceae bacterium]|nr:autotransporter domain-containing protein [Syntrophorhabdaceae bacterium]HOT41134.1 autotransporter domain-containing protein [Syntrophorhabdaceae bacterium]